MIARSVAVHLTGLAKQYPVVTVVGPRQSGKSTLCKAVFPSLPLVNLERPDERARIAEDPRAFVAAHKGGCIIDEIQYLPELASYIQVAVDERNRMGEFILTGSNQYQLMESVSQSLAGRTAIIRLLPLSLAELAGNEHQGVSLDQRLFTGGYPRIVSAGLDPAQALSFYVQTYLERDVRRVINVKDLALFERFIKLCATRSGQLLNATNLGAEAGIDQSTVRRWISVLETSFIVARLQPHHNNLSKRIIKSPKLYFLDTGLLCYLLGIRSADHLANHPLRGAIVETFVASELIKNRYNSVQEPAIAFFRDNAGHEIDFILDHGAAQHLVEVKASSTFNPEFLKNIRHYRSQPAARVEQSSVIYTGSERFSVDKVEVVPISQIGHL
jgi:predicted AAA+ superfamily ATPase